MGWTGAKRLQSQSSEGDIGGDTPRWQEQQQERMMQRAIKERWPMSDADRQKIIKRQIAIATGKTATNREATSAAKVLIAADALNQDESKEATPEQHLHLHQHGEDMNGTGLHSTERIERLRTRIAQQLGAGGTGEPGGD